MSKYDEALNAINRMYSDRSVSPETTRENLRGLRDEIDLLLDAIQQDIQQDIDQETDEDADEIIDSIGITAAQYHAGLDKLWAALGLTGPQDKDVFTLAAEAIIAGRTLSETIYYRKVGGRSKSDRPSSTSI